MKIENLRAKYMSLLDFQVQFADDLLSAGKHAPTAPKRGRPSISSSEERPSKRSPTCDAIPLPDGAARHDCFDHFAVFDDKKHRCRFCPKGYTFIRCEKCAVFLCMLKDRNCFYGFHKM